MKVSEIAKALEPIAPLELAAEWDNVGLLVGDGASRVKKLLVCIDLTREVLAEAVRARAEMVLAYHPVIFKPISRVTAESSAMVFEAVQRGIAIYAIHTAYDVVSGGTNDILAGVLGVVDPRPLEPVGGRQQCKIVVFVPPEDLSEIAQAAFSAGAGRIGNYHGCAFFTHGLGSYCAGEGSNPAFGEPGVHEMVEEIRLEVIAPPERAAKVCEAIASVHSYETPAIDVHPLAPISTDWGMGRSGPLRRSASLSTLVGRLKKATGVKRVLLARATSGAGARKGHAVKRAACGAGSCGGLFRAAAKDGATLYVTGEMRHHDLLEATASGLNVVCLGHSNSERLVLPSLADRVASAVKDVRVVLSQSDRDPLEIV
jgi:dinuclear metal center YbgI/SA1388 family protein